MFADMESFYKTNKADLAVISTPIFLHTQHILTALGSGSNVLCEKPLCSDEKDNTDYHSSFTLPFAFCMWEQVQACGKHARGKTGDVHHVDRWGEIRGKVRAVPRAFPAI